LLSVQFQIRDQSRGIEELLTAQRSPLQNALMKRVIGSIPRDRLDHVVVLSDRHLKCILASHFTSYNRWRTYQWLAMDNPES